MTLATAQAWWRHARDFGQRRHQTAAFQPADSQFAENGAATRWDAGAASIPAIN
ncbi:MAG: hypothetical protein IPN78_12720 [Candidatus Accumulibacter sp.]|nr:hypothetical protein [Candidatus Accumulibacter propinquus]